MCAKKHDLGNRKGVVFVQAKRNIASAQFGRLSCRERGKMPQTQGWVRGLHIVVTHDSLCDATIYAFCKPCQAFLKIYLFNKTWHENLRRSDAR
jgi:hypothetical protein